ncbi:hypothetical protein EBT16_13870 [bacterium]|nr:hypothetical protein [bacterium]
MYQVKCPECGRERSVRAKKKWMEGEPPFIKICMSCCQIGKKKSLETLAKLSEIAKRQQTPELIEKKRQFMKDHPECWQGKLVPGLGGGWNKGMHTDEETLRKISEGVRKAKEKK